jgi:hypothetical protein
MSTADAVAAFSERYRILFRPASPTELAAAESAGVPEALLEFYREYEPNESGTAEVRFFPLERVLAEMTDFVPGCHLSRHGYLAIAGTAAGDLFFVNPARSRNYLDMPVFLFGHEYDYRRLSAAQIEEFGSVIAKGIPDFLNRAASGTLNLDP